jgi:Outer membrane protein beta-barrel domain
VARSVAGIVTAVAVVSSWASPVRAQDQDRFAGMTGLQIGALAGANFFTFARPGRSLQPRSAMYAGPVLIVPLGRHLFFQPEVLYSAEGAKESAYTATYGTTDWTFKLSYLAAPVLVGFDGAAGASVSPRVYAGPVFALNLSCQFEASSPGQSGTFACSYGDLTAKSLAFGATVGGGLRFRAGAGSLMVEARYTFGLSRVFESWTVHTQGVSLGAGFSTPLGRH